MSKFSGLIACICEGNAEEVIVNKLLDEDKLLFSRDEMIERDVLNCRNAQEFEERYLAFDFPESITVLRILDSRKESFIVGELYKDKIKEIINVVTAREIEMLIIISEDKYDDYQKYKSNHKPSWYCKVILGYKNVKSKQFVEKYFEDTEKLIKTIRKYKSIKKIPKGEWCLCDLLK